MQNLSTIDQVYVINLKNRPDRLISWEKLLLNLPTLKNKLQFFTAVDGKALINETNLRNGELGCSMSHIAIWNEALTKNYRFILVLEDDVLFNEEFEIKLYDILQELNQDFDWLYLFNLYDYRPAEPFSNNLEKIIASLGTQGYVLNIKAIDRILPFVKEFNFPIDVVMGHMSFLSKVYRPIRVFLEHDELSVSDIANELKFETPPIVSPIAIQKSKVTILTKAKEYFKSIKKI